MSALGTDTCSSLRPRQHDMVTVAREVRAADRDGDQIGVRRRVVSLLLLMLERADETGSPLWMASAARTDQEHAGRDAWMLARRILLEEHRHVQRLSDDLVALVARFLGDDVATPAV